MKKIVALHIDRPTRPDDGAVVFQDHDAFLLPLHEEGHWLYSYVCAQWNVDEGRIVYAGAGSGFGYRLVPAIAREAAEILSQE
ncbi:hypothetical protein [Streptomyces sp. NPDC056669]|uniref:hypothetical protein n=1 Tax=unclassified Streptomyces TaxID=2593676 RepID=UPI00367F996C